MHSVSYSGTVPLTCGNCSRRSVELTAHCSSCLARGTILGVKSPIPGMWGTDDLEDSRGLSCPSQAHPFPGSHITSGSEPAPGKHLTHSRETHWAQRNSSWAEPRQGKGQRDVSGSYGVEDVRDCFMLHLECFNCTSVLTASKLLPLLKLQHSSLLAWGVP